MDNFTLYLDLIEQSCKSDDIQLPDTKDVLNMIEKKKLDLEPPKSVVRNIINFASQYDVVETQDEQWELNLN